MDKVVHFFKPFTTIFYLELFEFGKTGFNSNQVETDLKFISKFVFNLNPTAPHGSRPFSLSFPAGCAAAAPEPPWPPFLPAPALPPPLLLGHYFPLQIMP
jgi:hypothetical protein